MGERKFGFLAGLGFREWPAQEVLGCLRDLSYTGVSWPFSWFDPRQRPADALPRLVERTRERGMEVAELGVQQDFIFPLLGEGLVEWPAFLDALDDVGYDGFLTVEFESFTYHRTVLDNDPSRAAAVSMEQIRALMGRQQMENE